MKRAMIENLTLMHDDHWRVPCGNKKDKKIHMKMTIKANDT